MPQGNWQKLSTLDWALSRLGLFGLGKSYLFQMPRRPLARFMAIGGAPFMGLDVLVNAPDKATIFDAVTLKRRYFGLDFKPLDHQLHPLEIKSLIALPGANPAVQTLWLCPPEKARFALVEFNRNTAGTPIGFRLKPRLKKRAALKPMPLSDDTQKLFDPFPLWQGLLAALGADQGGQAMTILERLRYLQDNPILQDAQITLAENGTKAAEIGIQSTGVLTPYR